MANWKDKLETWQELGELARNPFYLTLLAYKLNKNPKGKLPQTRLEFIEYLFKYLLDREVKRWMREKNKDKYEIGLLKGADAENKTIECLHNLGWILNLYKREREKVLSEEKLTNKLGNLFDREKVSPPIDVAEDGLKFWMNAGVFAIGQELEKKVKNLTFRVNLFREYAAAKRLEKLYKRDKEEVLKFLEPRLHHPAWREPIMFFSEMLGDKELYSFVDQLLKGKSPEEKALRKDLFLATELFGNRIKIKGDLKKLNTEEKKLRNRLEKKLIDISRPYTGIKVLIEVLLFSVITILMVKAFSGWWKWGAISVWVLAWIFSFIIPVLPRLQNILTRPIHFLGFLHQCHFKNAIDHLFLLKSEKVLPLFFKQDFSSLFLISLKSENFLDYIEKIKRIGPRSIPYLNKGLQSEDAQVKKVSIIGLGQTGDSTSVDGLIKELNNEDSQTRGFVITALGNIGDSKAVPALKKFIKEKAENGTYGEKVEASKVLRVLAKLGGEKVISFLIETLNKSSHDSYSMYISLIEVLGETKNREKVVPALFEFFIRREDYKEEIINALVSIYKDGEISELRALIYNPENIKEKIDFQNFNVEWDSSAKLVQDLASIVYARLKGRDAFFEFQHNSEENDQALNNILFNRICEIFIKLEDRDLVLGFINSRIEEIRINAIKALGRIGDDQAALKLIPLLYNEKGWIRVKIIQALGEIGSKDALEELFKILKNPKDHERKEVVEALVGNKDALERIFENLKNPKDHEQKDIVGVLGKMDNKEVIIELKKYLEDPDQEVRTLIIKAFIRIKDPIIFKYIGEIFKDKDIDKSTKRSLVELLNETNNDRVIKPMIDLLEDKHIVYDNITVQKISLSVLTRFWG